MNKQAPRRDGTYGFPNHEDGIQSGNLTGQPAAPQDNAHPSNADKPPSAQNEEQHKTASENVRQGYGSSVKSRLMSGKPDGDTQGGPGPNNDNAN